MFDRGNVGEFDDVEYDKEIKAFAISLKLQGGVVDRSWIDLTAIKPVWKNRQIETDLSV